MASTFLRVPFKKLRTKNDDFGIGDTNDFVRDVRAVIKRQIEAISPAVFDKRTR
jgi:hypothetical protein